MKQANQKEVGSNNKSKYDNGRHNNDNDEGKLTAADNNSKKRTTDSHRCNHRRTRAAITATRGTATNHDKTHNNDTINNTNEQTKRNNANNKNRPRNGQPRITKTLEAKKYLTFQQPVVNPRQSGKQHHTQAKVLETPRHRNTLHAQLFFPLLGFPCLLMCFLPTPFLLHIRIIMQVHIHTYRRPW